MLFIIAIYISCHPIVEETANKKRRTTETRNIQLIQVFLFCFSLPLFVSGPMHFNRSKPLYRLKADPVEPTWILRTLWLHSPGLSNQLPESFLASGTATVCASICNNPIIQLSQYQKVDLSLFKSGWMSVGCFSQNVSSEIFICCFVYSYASERVTSGLQGSKRESS